MDSSNDSLGAISSRASVRTDRAARYGKQLSAHLGHKRKTSWHADTLTGDVRFDHGRATLIATSTRLDLAIELDAAVVGQAAAAELTHIEDVVGRHLVRFGERDELVVSWVRADGSPGQVYGQATGDPVS
ncbi:MAG TPA: DUF2218 domain-containing protein [Jiangellaceae bacterium]|nr:DUF2218 domain-containing protein [Jiangellaceae bacterium]